MSTDDKTRAAAAQQAIDDEPDDWCVQLMRFCKRSQASDEYNRDKRIFSTGCAGGCDSLCV
jgi:hypothetical protein